MGGENVQGHMQSKMCITTDGCVGTIEINN